MLKQILRFLLVVLFGSQLCYGQIRTMNPVQQQHVEVSMRKIGHEVLLSLGDSTSRVLPIESDGNKFRIKFESDFVFNPDELSSIIDTVINQTAIATEYVVEVLSCEHDLVVHSYKIGSDTNSDIMACGGRDYDSGCYSLQITILNYDRSLPVDKAEIVALASQNMTEDYGQVYQLLAGLVLVVLMLAGFIVYRNRRNSNNENNPNLIHIGKFRFNKRYMELWFNDEKIELTSKECDLLQLLCDSTNDTVERETILKMVWGDEGDYVGRTLDVFISKLRKKLEADDSVRIVNIRGIGYKLVLNN